MVGQLLARVSATFDLDLVEKLNFKQTINQRV